MAFYPLKVLLCVGVFGTSSGCDGDVCDGRDDSAQLMTNEQLDSNLLSDVSLLQIKVEVPNHSLHEELSPESMKIKGHAGSLIADDSRAQNSKVENSKVEKQSEQLQPKGKMHGKAEVDMNGRPCGLCWTPLPERWQGEGEYKQRTDCGNHSLTENPANVDVPLITFKRDASEGQPETSAWCELNLQKMCADAIYNENFLYQAKAVLYNGTYDRYYCLHNGWLTNEIRALQHNFTGMKARAEKECNSREDGWNTTMTLSNMMDRYLLGYDSGMPSPKDARFIGSWTCAMGSAGCDMAYCAYSFCDLGNGKVGLYDECEGWDPVKGMPFH